MRRTWTREEIGAAYRPVHEAIAGAVSDCADALVRALAAAMETPSTVELRRSNPMTPGQCEDGTEFLHTLEYQGVRYSALAEVAVHDSLRPGVAVRAAVGRGEAEHAIEVRTPVQRFWDLERPDIAELVLDHVRRITARAAEIGRLTAPILIALDEKSVEGETILSVTIPPADPNGPLRIAAPDSA